VYDNHRRRDSFGAIATAYDRERMRYPNAVFDAIIERSGIGRAVEIGPGTGIATIPMAERGFGITGVEPSAEMAAIAKAKLASFGPVRIEVASYEEWEPEGTYDLVYAAQSWHWITPEARFEKTPALLKADGCLAVFGNMATGRLPEAQEAYRLHYPKDLRDRRPAATLEERIARVVDPIRERYRDVELLRWPWSRRHTADEYVRLLGTYSDHSTVPEPNRTRLFEAIAEAIEQAGGSVKRDYLTVLILARPK
jgi:SAM-dependent methyltransferase